MKYTAVILFLLIVITSSGQPHINSIAVVKCDADTSQSYALYLPENYSRAKLFPVIFLFDPSAQGENAVSFFKEAARTLEFIAISSNNSENGPASVSLNAAGAVFTDAFKKYSIDGTRVYLAGFSGGARIATTIALQNSNRIAGVLACGASFAGAAPNTPLPWPFEGTTGTRDFNNVEMNQVKQRLDGTHSINNLIVFKGPHRWLPPQFTLEALLWLDLCHRKKTLMPTDTNLLRYRAIVEDKIAKTQGSLQKMEMYHQLQFFLADKAYADKARDLEASVQYKKDLSTQQQYIIKEVEYQKKIGDALSLIEQNSNDLKPKSWWKIEYTIIEKMQASGLSADSDFFWRQKAYVHANINVDFQNYYDVKKYDIVTELLNVSDIFDNENPTVAYHHAQLAATGGNENEAINYLEKAVKQGLRNKNFVLNDPVFKFIRTNKRFQVLIND